MPSARSSEKSPDLSVITVSYNVRDCLAACLESVGASLSRIEHEVLVVDNASGDGSAEMVRRRFPSVGLIASPANLGFARACNVAIRQSRGRIVLLLNPDTEILKGDFEGLIGLLDGEPRIGAVGAKLLNADGTVQPSCYRFPNLRDVVSSCLLGGALSSGPLRFDYDESRDVDFVRGAFMAIRRSCLDEVGLFDETFFMYAEEADLCRRMRLEGWRVVYAPIVEVVHHKGKSAAQVPDDMYVERMRSLIRYFRKHHAGDVAVLRSVIAAGALARFAVRAIADVPYSRARKRVLSRRAHLRVARLAMGLGE